MSNAPENSAQPLPPSQPPAVPPTAPPAAANAPSPSPKKEETPSDPSLAGIIDTIEAIIIALIVALTFRAFIVEAFVIPTGSMAPTLLGAHYDVICPECGYRYKLDADIAWQVRTDGKVYIIRQGQREELRDNRGVPLTIDRERAIVCPNCRYEAEPRQLPQFLAKESSRDTIDERFPTRPTRKVPFAWANNGDRILVLKYLYSVAEPTRWDVIVFKEPQKTQDNYIKRLVGLPGETLEIINGDIYIRKPGAQGPLDFQIARKPEHVQNSLWQLVYDNDYYPMDAADLARPAPNPIAPRKVPFKSPWESPAAWTKGPVMTYAGDGPSSLTFNLQPPHVQGAPYTLNTLGYNNDYGNSWSTSGNPQEVTPRSFVGDLRLETLWTPAAAMPQIDLTLGRPSNCYRVTWSAAGLKLFRFNPTARAFEPVAISTETVPAPEAGKSYALAMNNVDRSVQFYIDGDRVLSFEQSWTRDEAIEDQAQFSPLHPADANAIRGSLGLPTTPGQADALIRIDVSGSCSLSHTKLLRDLYYTQIYGRGTPSGTEGNPVVLHADEFFALGDNSRRSSDSRFWDSTYYAGGDLGLRNGVVPRRYLLGKAFFVYWPAGYRASDTIPFLNNVPLIPNAGEMRVIR